MSRFTAHRPFDTSPVIVKIPAPSSSDFKSLVVTGILMFSSGPGTPLYSLTWIPVSEGNYSGTCVFPIVLAVIFRALVALRSVLKRR